MDFSQRKGSALWFPQAMVVALASLGSVHAVAAEVASQAASAVVSKSVVKPTVGKVVKAPVTVGGVAAKGDENQYPTGSMPIPPKPKKEGLEAAGALKAKAAQP
jgi:hypothetical protein